jgi:hypothetical protein
MRQRDLLEEEVLGALRAPASQHRHRSDEPSEVLTRVGRKMLLVVYRRDGEEMVLINVMWED